MLKYAEETYTHVQMYIAHTQVRAFKMDLCRMRLLTMKSFVAYYTFLKLQVLRSGIPPVWYFGCPYILFTQHNDNIYCM